MKWSKQTCENLGAFFEKKYNEFFFESPSDQKYKEFLKENNIQEFYARDLYLCINEKTEDNVIVYRKTSVSKTTTTTNLNDWEITSASYSTTSLDLEQISHIIKNFEEVKKAPESITNKLLLLYAFYKK